MTRDDLLLLDDAALKARFVELAAELVAVESERQTILDIQRERSVSAMAKARWDTMTEEEKAAFKALFQRTPE